MSGFQSAVARGREREVVLQAWIVRVLVSHSAGDVHQRWEENGAIRMAQVMSEGTEVTDLAFTQHEVEALLRPRGSSWEIVSFRVLSHLTQM